MKAVVITSFGGPEVLQIRDVEEPQPAAGQIRVKIRAAGLNRADILQRRGLYPAPPGYRQDIPGLEFAGEVDVIGANVQSWQPGQRVFGITAGEAQAEYVVVPESHAVEIPSNLDWAEAGAVPEVFVTAHDALFTRANLRRDEALLIHAAASGVGTAAIQLARAAGARVFGTSRTVEKLERIKHFGLSDFVTVQGDPQVFLNSVREWTGGCGVNVILDLVGAPYLEANLNALAEKGRIVFVGTTAGSKATLDLALVMRKRATMVGTVLRARLIEEKAAAVRLFEEAVVPLLTNEVVQPVVDRVFKMEDVQQAHAHMESNDNVGKIVLMW